MSENAKWYVLHTYSGYENKVVKSIETAIKNRDLHELILDVKLPMEKVEEIKNGKKEITEKAIFPSYVLVKMVVTDETWYVVRNITGVTGFVGPEKKPTPLTDEEVQNLGVERFEVVVNYQVGDLVKILYGPFENHIGKVEEIDTENGTVEVIISMLGRETPVELDLDEVELVS